jgi:quinol-cytochrome oxidoreductase complex cytochrome b subunit
VDILVNLLIFCLIAGIVYWIVLTIIGLLPIAQPFKNIILAIFLIICLIYVLGFFAGYSPMLYHGSGRVGPLVR